MGFQLQTSILGFRTEGPNHGSRRTVGHSIINPVEPGNQLTISVKMTAPATLGTYVNYFRMMNGEGKFFGDPLYVQIQVGTTEDKTPVPTG